MVEEPQNEIPVIKDSHDLTAFVQAVNDFNAEKYEKMRVDNAINMLNAHMENIKDYLVSNANITATAISNISNEIEAIKKQIGEVNE